MTFEQIQLITDVIFKMWNNLILIIVLSLVGNMAFTYYLVSYLAKELNALEA